MLDEDALLDKLVGRRRGGFCYELNGAFGALLAHLGYDVTLLAARVFGAGGALGPPYDHLALRVDLPRRRGGAGWSTSGSGASSAEPLRLDERGDQADPLGTVRLVETGDGDLDVLLDGTPQYRLDLRPRELGDFAATCWFQQTHPTSHFATSLVCSLPTPGRPGHAERPAAGHHRRRRAHRADAGLRRRGAGRLPRPVRHHARPGADAVGARCPVTDPGGTEVPDGGIFAG